MFSATSIEPQSVVGEVVRKVITIATLPEVTARIVAVVDDPKSTMAQLQRIVSHDPTLVARILKVVNSAFYGLSGQIASIERAIVLLGLSAVKNIAVAASLGQMFKSVGPGEQHSAKDLWIHCVAVSVTARELSRQMRVALEDEAFLAGMIHDLGLLALLQVFPDRLRLVCAQARTPNTDFCALERELIGMDHQLLGSALCEQWKFPRSCQLVVGNHHQPTALRPEDRLLTSLISVADRLCSQGGYGFDLPAQTQEVEDIWVGSMPLGSAAVEQVRTILPALVGNALALFACP